MIINIVEIVRELFPSVFDRGTIWIIDLCPASDAWFNLMPLSKIWDSFGELVDEIGAFGPRADHAHVAAQNIKELW